MGLLTRDKEGTKWDRWIGERIRTAREEKGWTQSQLAEAMHKSQTNISDYERGRLQISVVDLLYIALALDKPLTFFTPPKFNGATPNDLSPRQKEIIHHINQASDEMELALLEQAKTFARISARVQDQKLKDEIEQQREEIEAEKRRARELLKRRRKA